MAQSTTLDSLKDTLIRYLQIRENLGERELVLAPETMQALAALKASSGPERMSNLSQTQHTSVKASVQKKEPRPRDEVDFRQPTAAAAVKTAKPAPAGASAGRDLSGMDKGAALEAIRAEIHADAGLRQLFKRSQKMVFGAGNPAAEIMFIGEAPGVEEDETGEPFVGAAGQLLDKMIVAMGLQRDEVYIANIVKYRPDMPEGSRGNRKPTPEELARCRPHILRQISVIQPAVIVGLGATAMEGLLNQPRVSITRLRGQWENFEGIPLMPTFHPAYLLHNDAISEKRKVWEDLLQVMEKVALPISEKQQRYFKGKR